MLSVAQLSAQLPDGSIAPDFTATDINGTEWNLYDLLDQGKKVILDFSATWCGPCWNYHSAGILEEVWDTYGPDGTDEAYVFFIESDDSTTPEDLAGTGSNTTGNWIEGTGYPIIDDGGAIFGLYTNGYYPTIYTICPNRMLTESGQISAADHAAIFNQNSCAAASLALDPTLLNSTGEVTGCVDEPAGVSVAMMNMGTETLTSTTVGMFINDIEVGSTSWTGNLSTYGIAEVILPDYSFSADTEYEVRITGADLNPDNNVVAATFDLGEISSTFLYLEILTDSWGEETSWELRDGNGDVVQSVAAGTLANLTEYTWEIEVEVDACYFFALSDAYGDGLFGSQWGGESGNCRLTSLAGFPGSAYVDSPLSTVLFNDGTSAFFELTAAISTSYGDVSGWTEGCTDPAAFNYDAEAQINDNSCVYEVGCGDIGAAFWGDDFPLGVFPESVFGYVGDVLWYQDGSTMVSGFVLNVPNTIVDPATGTEYAVYSFDVGQITGLPDGVDWASAMPGEIFGGEQHCLEPSGYPISVGLYSVEVQGEMAISVFGNSFPLGTISVVFDMEVFPNPNPVSGCAYVGAMNFNPIANADDGSCEFSGCTDPSAVNYHMMITVDDGGCVYDLDGGPNPCPADLNGDELVGVGDLLVLLGEFGGACQ